MAKALVESLAYKLTDEEADKLSETLSDQKIGALLYTLADTLSKFATQTLSNNINQSKGEPVVECLGGSLSEVEGEKLKDTVETKKVGNSLAEMLAKVEPKTPSEKLSEVKAKPLVDALADAVTLFRDTIY